MKKASPITHSFAKIDPSYVNKIGQFPDRSIDPALKGADYYMGWAKAIYSIFLNDRTSWGASAFSHDNLLRLYANGQQPVDVYQNSLLGEPVNDNNLQLNDLPISKVARREGWYNVLWRPISLAPKLMSNIQGMLDSVDFDIFINAIDSSSRDVEATAKAKAYVLSLNKEFLMKYKGAAGLPTEEEKSIPDNSYEIEMLERADGFKVNYAKAMQKLVRHSMDVSGWNDVLYKKLLTDLLTLGRCATRSYFDPEDKKFKTKYIDVARAGVQFSNDLDFSDAEYAFYLDLMQISELRILMPELSEAELLSIAESSVGLFGNAKYIQGGAQLISDPQMSPADLPWNNFYISVFDCEFMDYDISRAMMYKNTYGVDRYVPLKFSEPLPTPTTRQQRKGVSIKEKVTEIRQPKQCRWIVGTNYVLPDYGKTHFAARPQPSKPRLSFTFEQLIVPSLIEQIYPVLDQFQLTWYKYQNTRAQAIESGFALDWGMLINLTDGDGKKYPLDEILKMWKQTGLLSFMTSRYGGYAGGAVTPVTPIPNNLQNDLATIQQDFQIQFMLFEQITGINPVALGQSPNPEAPVATTEAALQSTTNVLKPVITATRELKENIATSLMSKIQSGVKAEPVIRKVYEAVIGKSNVQYIIDAEKDGVQYGMKSEAKPDQLFKQNIAKYIAQSLQNGRDGQVGIRLPEAMLLEERMLRGEDFTQIRQDFTYLLDRAEKQMLERENQKIDRQNQGLQQLEVTKAQAAQQKAQFDGMTLQMQESEKRKTERMIQNYSFLNKLMETAQNEQKAGMVNPVTLNRLKLAMQVSAGVDLSMVDLPTEVSKMEQMMGFMRGGANPPPPQPASAGPTFAPTSAPEEPAMV